MGIISGIIDKVVAAWNPQKGVKRAHARAVLERSGSYLAAKNNRIFKNFRPTSLSADADLNGTVKELMQRSRHAYRNYPGMRAAIEARVGVVVATGIDLEPNTGDPKVDAKLREVWRMYEEQVDAAKKLHFKEMQRQGFRGTCLNGAGLYEIVTIVDKTRMIPIALNSIEADQLSSEPKSGKIPNSHKFSEGIETNKFGEAIWYHITDHPGDEGLENFKSSNEIRKIPAKNIIHVYEALRAGQTTGEPIMVPALQRLVQEEDLIEAELISSQLGAAFAVAITSELEEGGAFNQKEEAGDDNEDDAGNEEINLSAGVIARLNPGDKLQVVQNTRPSQQIAPFRQMLRGDIAATIGISRTDLDKDYSQANYSSMRAAMLDKRRLLTPVQKWFGRDLVTRLYLRVLPLLAVVADVHLAEVGTMERMRQERHILIPDGWEYVDPEKDIGAALMAIQGGMSNFRDELGQRGKDAEDVHTQLEKEIEKPLMKKLIELYGVKRSESKTESTSENKTN